MIYWTEKQLHVKIFGQYFKQFRTKISMTPYFACILPIHIVFKS